MTGERKSLHIGRNFSRRETRILSNDVAVKERKERKKKEEEKQKRKDEKYKENS